MRVLKKLITDTTDEAGVACAVEKFVVRKETTNLCTFDPCTRERLDILSRLQSQHIQK